MGWYVTGLQSTCFAIPELPAFFWRALSLICGKQISFLQGRSLEDGHALWIHGVYVCSTLRAALTEFTLPLHWACLAGHFCFPFRCEHALLGWSTRISTHERVRDYDQKTLHCLREFDCVESRHAQGLSYFDDTGPIVLHGYFEYFSLSNSVLRWILLLTCFQSWFNDCPPSWSYLSDTCVGQAKNPGPRVSFGIVNPTAVHGKSEVLSQLNCDVLICAETSATAEVQRIETGRWNKLGYTTTWTHAVPPLTGETVRANPVRGKGIGVSCFSKLPIRRSYTEQDPIWEATCRYLERWVRIGDLDILIIGFYLAPHSPGTGADNINQALFGYAAQRARQSRGPVLLAGDFNGGLRPLTAWSDLQMFGYVDLLQRAREHAPDTVSPTCDDSTWNDTILVSPQLVPLVRQTGVLTAHAFDRHKPFKVEFEFPNHAILTKRLQLPSGWNVPSHAEPLLESAYSACATERWETVQSLPAGDRLGAWAQMVEHSVSWACNQHAEPLRKRQKGRCQGAHIANLMCPPIPKPAGNGQFEPEIDMRSFHYVHVVRQVRRLESLHRTLQSLGQRPPTMAQQSSLRDLWTSILRAPGFGGQFSEWIHWHSGTSLPARPWEWPVNSWLDTIIETVKLYAQEVVQLQRTRSQHMFKETVTHNLSQHGGSLVYHLLRPPSRPPITHLDLHESVPYQMQRAHHKGHLRLTVERPEGIPLDAIVRVENSRAQVVGHERHCLVCTPISGQIPPRGTLVWTTWVTATAQVEEQIASFWNQFWQRDPPLQQVEDDHWLAARQMVDTWAEQRNPVDIDLANVSVWQEALRGTPAKSSKGMCGWNKAELSLLPQQAWQHLVSIIQDCVHANQWPDWFTQSRTVLLPKTDSPGVSDTRPITVFPLLYRLFCKVVTRQLLDTFATWMPKQIIGGVPGRSSEMIWLRIQHEVDEALHNARPRAGSCLDLLKTPDHIVRTWRTWLSASTRTLIVNREPGPFRPSTTGCAEGDPLSVAAIVALGYLWYVVVHAQGVQVCFNRQP